MTIRSKAWQRGNKRVRSQLKEELHLRIEQFNNKLNGGRLDNEVMTAFCRNLETRNNKRPFKILSPVFYEALTNSNRAHTDTERGKMAMQAAARYTHYLDVYQYDLLLIPVRVGPNNTSVAVDMATLQIRYLDSTHEWESEHILKIRR